LEILQKSSGSQGFYTSTKILQFLNESIDYVTAQMMLSETGAWEDITKFIDTAPGGTSYPLPTDMVILKTVRYLYDTVYMPLTYDEAHTDMLYNDVTGIQYTFTLAAPATISAGSTYTNNGSTFTVLNNMVATDQMVCTTNIGSPLASGTLTYVSGSTPGNLVFNSFINFPNSGLVQYPSRYRILNGQIFFNPTLAVGGTASLMLEYCAYPDDVSGSDDIPQNLHKAFQHFVKYRTASACAASIGKFNKEWQDQADEWKDIMMRLVNKRINSNATIKEFMG
jgi:hypothetical protein